jgi:16S rRNA (cytosine967-C5)-methyltransferase
LAIVLAKSKEISPARLAAFRILQQVDNGAFSSILLASEEPRLQPTDRALCHQLVLGVLRWQLRLDTIVEHFSKRPIESLDQAVRIALRLGLYQLHYLTRIPVSAAVNESVTLVRHARVSSATAFVNAVLRRAVKEANFEPAAGVSDPLARIAIQTSHPVWLIERWANAFGIAEAEAFAAANNTVPPTAFRVVTTRADENEVVSRLRAAASEVKASQVTEGAWRVAGATSLVRELSAAGEIYLQDEASQLVARVLDVKPGERVLDLCAAPGGKTTLMADGADDAAVIVAADVSASRMETVVGTTGLQQLKSIKPVLLDASEPLPFKSRAFDKVLVDAPCSGTGTLRRNPEIRWRLTEPDVGAFAEVQKQILSRAADVVKPGGRLVYSTCSVEREENEEVFEEFLRRQNFDLLDTVRTWPHREQCDGFFIASFESR